MIANCARDAYEGFDGQADVDIDAVDLTTIDQAKGRARMEGGCARAAGGRRPAVGDVPNVVTGSLDDPCPVPVDT